MQTKSVNAHPVAEIPPTAALSYFNVRMREYFNIFQALLFSMIVLTAHDGKPDKSCATARLAKAATVMAANEYFILKGLDFKKTVD